MRHSLPHPDHVSLSMSLLLATRSFSCDPYRTVTRVCVKLNPIPTTRQVKDCVVDAQLSLQMEFGFAQIRGNPIFNHYFRPSVCNVDPPQKLPPRSIIGEFLQSLRLDSFKRTVPYLLFASIWY